MYKMGEYVHRKHPFGRLMGIYIGFPGMVHNGGYGLPDAGNRNGVFFAYQIGKNIYLSIHSHFMKT